MQLWASIVNAVTHRAEASGGVTGMKMIVGLGNPGSEYRGTRHNAGADFLQALARQCFVIDDELAACFGQDLNHCFKVDARACDVGRPAVGLEERRGVRVR